eukprot:jgi/Mesvir1/27332/Mv07148-RA.1
MPDFMALKCFQCETFQVLQVKKSSNKWACKICNEKQSGRLPLSQLDGQAQVSALAPEFSHGGPIPHARSEHNAWGRDAADWSTGAPCHHGDDGDDIAYDDRHGRGWSAAGGGDQNHYGGGNDESTHEYEGENNENDPGGQKRGADGVRCSNKPSWNYYLDTPAAETDDPIEASPWWDEDGPTWPGEADKQAGRRYGALGQNKRSKREVEDEEAPGGDTWRISGGPVSAHMGGLARSARLQPQSETSRPSHWQPQALAATRSAAWTPAPRFDHFEETETGEDDALAGSKHPNAAPDVAAAFHGNHLRLWGNGRGGQRAGTGGGEDCGREGVVVEGGMTHWMRRTLGEAAGGGEWQGSGDVALEASRAEDASPVCATRDNSMYASNKGMYASQGSAVAMQCHRDGGGSYAGPGYIALAANASMPQASSKTDRDSAAGGGMAAYAAAATRGPGSGGHGNMWHGGTRVAHQSALRQRYCRDIKRSNMQSMPTQVIAREKHGGLLERLTTDRHEVCREVFVKEVLRRTIHKHVATFTRKKRYRHVHANYTYGQFSRELSSNGVTANHFSENGFLEWRLMATKAAMENPSPRSDLLLVRNVTIYEPQLNTQCRNILIGGETILSLTTDEQAAHAEALIAAVGGSVIDGQGCIAAPGIVDIHVHLTGGGGEMGFHSRTPEASLQTLVTAGVTTVVGVLGFDQVTRSLENLLGKVEALNAEGMTAYMYTGAYGLPTPTLTGSVMRDVSLIRPCIGAGEIAVSDHRSGVPNAEELAKLAQAARVGGMLAGKSGVTYCHMGDGQARLAPLRDAVHKYGVPITTFLPTHVSRNKELLQDGIEWVSEGGYIDITPHSDASVAAVAELKHKGVDLTRVMCSSDAQGSVPAFNDKGNIIAYRVGDCGVLLRLVQKLFLEYGWGLPEALALITSTPASYFKFANKGRLAVGFHADILLLDATSLELRTYLHGVGRWNIKCAGTMQH